MFNASWIAPNLLTMQLQNNKNSNNIFENPTKLPLIPLRNQLMASEKPQFKMQQQVNHLQNSLNFQDMLETNQKNKLLLKEIMNAVNQDLHQQYKQKQSYIQTQEGYEPKAKPHKRRYPSYDRYLEDDNKYKQIGKISLKQKSNELRNYSITEKISKGINLNEINMRDSSIEFETKYRNNNKVLNQNPPYINYKIHKYAARESKQNLGHMKESLKKQQQRFKIVGYVVFAAMCLNKKQRKIQKEQNEQKNLINQNYQESQKIIDKYSKRQVIVNEKLYYEYVVEKVIHYLKDQSFINETQNIQNLSTEYQSDIRKLHVFKFTTLLFKNVELFTRQNTISDLIAGLLNISLYEKTHIPVSKFVGQRCNFYNDNHLKIPQEQLVLIALEHYFFDNLIPQLFEILANFQEEKNTKLKVNTNSLHLNECYFYVCIFAALIQQKILQNFSQMKMIKSPNGKIVQKTLKTVELQNLVIKAQIVIDNQLIENKNEIVKGLISSDLILALESEKPLWKKFIDQTFTQIITNFQNILPKQK